MGCQAIPYPIYTIIILILILIIFNFVSMKFEVFGKKLLITLVEISKYLWLYSQLTRDGFWPSPRQKPSHL